MIVVGRGQTVNKLVVFQKNIIMGLEDDVWTGFGVFLKRSLFLASFSFLNLLCVLYIESMLMVNQRHVIPLSRDNQLEATNVWEHTHYVPGIHPISRSSRHNRKAFHRYNHQDVT